MTLDNWQTAPHLHWSFQHIADIFPTATISRGPDRRSRPASRTSVRQRDLDMHDMRTEVHTVGATMQATETDGWMVVHHGGCSPSSTACDMEPDTLHLLMSVSKSLVGVVAGALVGGLLDVEDLVTAYVPELCDSGLRRGDGAPPARHAIGHRLLRGLPRPERGGPTARAGHRLGTAQHTRLPGTLRASC